MKIKNELTGLIGSLVEAKVIGKDGLEKLGETFEDLGERTTLICGHLSDAFFHLQEMGKGVLELEDRVAALETSRTKDPTEGTVAEDA